MIKIQFTLNPAHLNISKQLELIGIKAQFEFAEFQFKNNFTPPYFITDFFWILSIVVERKFIETDRNDYLISRNFLWSEFQIFCLATYYLLRFFKNSIVKLLKIAE